MIETSSLRRESLGDTRRAAAFSPKRKRVLGAVRSVMICPLWTSRIRAFATQKSDATRLPDGLRRHDCGVKTPRFAEPSSHKNGRNRNGRCT